MHFYETKCCVKAIKVENLPIIRYSDFIFAAI